MTWTSNGDGTYHVSGTATGISTAVAEQVELAAGTYEVGGVDTTVAAIKVSTDSGTSLLDTRYSDKLRGELAAGTYRVNVFVLAGKSVDTDLTPFLHKVG